MSLRLLVKGTKKEAIDAARRHLGVGCGVVHVGVAFGGEQLLSVPDAAARACVEWHCESGEIPFPAGTLLFYNPENHGGAS